jgi:hypothetical protein
MNDDAIPHAVIVMPAGPRYPLSTYLSYYVLASTIESTTSSSSLDDLVQGLIIGY